MQIPGAGALGCTGTYPPWMCKAFGDKAPEEREKIVKYNKMCIFCLRHSTEDICYAKMADTKPSCLVPECNKGHIQWLHKILISRYGTGSTKRATQFGGVDVVRDSGAEGPWMSHGLTWWSQIRISALLT
jgi:hypothetical protein